MEQNFGSYGAGTHSTLGVVPPGVRRRDDSFMEATKCPKCNGYLVMRKITEGVYAGSRKMACRSFPKCDYVDCD